MVVAHPGHRLRRKVSVNNRDVNSTLLESTSVLEDHRESSSTLITSLPFVSYKLFSVEFLNSTGNFLLLQSDERFHPLPYRQAFIMYAGPLTHCCLLFGEIVHTNQSLFKPLVFMLDFKDHRTTNTSSTEKTPSNMIFVIILYI